MRPPGSGSSSSAYQSTRLTLSPSTRSALPLLSIGKYTGPTTGCEKRTFRSKAWLASICSEKCVASWDKESRPVGRRFTAALARVVGCISVSRMWGVTCGEQAGSHKIIGNCELMAERVGVFRTPWEIRPFFRHIVHERLLAVVLVNLNPILSAKRPADRTCSEQIQAFTQHAQASWSQGNGRRGHRTRGAPRCVAPIRQAQTEGRCPACDGVMGSATGRASNVIPRGWSRAPQGRAAPKAAVYLGAGGLCRRRKAFRAWRTRQADEEEVGISSELGRNATLGLIGRRRRRSRAIAGGHLLGSPYHTAKWCRLCAASRRH